MRRFICSLLLCTAVAAPIAAQQPSNRNQQLEYTRSHYTKYEFRIPMRDGVKLFTAVYVPKDTSERYPILMQRTPYDVGPYGIDNYRAVIGPSELAEREGFIFAYQDVRGRYMSEGTFIDVPPHKATLKSPKDTDESSDTYDTIEWLVKNVPNNNGRVGMWGISYPGFFAAFALVNAHPALKAVSPQAPMGDVGNGDDAYHNGAFFLAANFGFYTFFKPRGPAPELPRQQPAFDFGTKDEYDFYLRMGPLANANQLYLHGQNAYWDDMLNHPSYDEFWQSRAQAPEMKNVTPAVLFVGGWFDAEDLSGPLKLFRAIEKNGPKAPNTLIMGPWCHGCWARGTGQTLGNLNFASNTGEFFREHIELPFFIQNLKGKSDGLKAPPNNEIPKAWLFETGTNQWRRFPEWPPKNSSPACLYLEAKGALSFTAPSDSGFDEYISDPAKPVPVLSGIGEGMPRDYMTYDQRFASRRPDVLVYLTPPLDHDVTVIGPVTPVLKVSTSGTDSDFIVKLVDVYPNDYPNPDPNPANLQMGGYQQLVRGEPFRGKYRNSMSKPEPFSPGKPERIEYMMPDIFHTFRTGHRIMVQIQSTWFPLIDRNPQQFEEIPTAKASDFVKATQRVYYGGENGSLLRVLLIQ
ncbi:MAG: CocE/NonD family hydrolase [Acidobacteriaceae bacterium]|nr:CocE/NonD family hydrolase [Acidobacteriaceae bacterium]